MNPQLLSTLKKIAGHNTTAIILAWTAIQFTVSQWPNVESASKDPHFWGSFAVMVLAALYKAFQWYQGRYSDKPDTTPAAKSKAKKKG